MTKSDGIILTEGLIICQQHAFGTLGIWVIGKDKSAVIEMRSTAAPGNYSYNHVSTVYRDRNTDWPGYTNDEIVSYMVKNWRPRGVFKSSCVLLDIVKKYAPVMFSN